MAAASRGGARYRSMLYVPGHKPDWMLKAEGYDADALLFDLEDAVPLESKELARVSAAEALARPTDRGRFVRVNAWGSGFLLADLDAVVRPGLTGVFLPKTAEPSDVIAIDRILTELEVDRGLTPGSIEISPICETAEGVYRHYEICLATPRIRRAGTVGHAVSGDLTHALGVTSSTEEATEALHFTVRSGLEARAVGIEHIIGGMTAVIDDLDLVRRVALRARAVGATCATVIHPAHVPIVNEVFSPSDDEVRRARELVVAMAEALERGDAAARYDGRMIDYAQVRSGQDLLELARSLGMDVGEVPDVHI
jgi:citrate lyase subunit beta/citryl-CoA lyase